MEIIIKCTARELRDFITGSNYKWSITKDGFVLQRNEEQINIPNPKEKDLEEKTEPQEKIDCGFCKNFEFTENASTCKHYGASVQKSIPRCARDNFTNFKHCKDDTAPKERTQKQQEDINAIKQAYEAKRAENKTRAAGAKKKINIAYVIAEHDHNKRSFESIAKEYGVCTQTIINHYKKEMERRTNNE